MRRKRILDLAEENPDASMEELASWVASATPELVERVFEEHGDPAVDDDPTGTNSAPTGSGNGIQPDGASHDVEADDDRAKTPMTAQTTDSTPESTVNAHPSPDDLTEKQREVLEAIARRPGATQQEIAAQFDVSRATISNRVNSIDGFEWADREAFVEAVLGDARVPEVTMDGGSTPDTTPTDAEEPGTDDPQSVRSGAGASQEIAELAGDIERLEGRISELERSRRESPQEAIGLEDPELVHKVVHACMQAESIDESEELRIVKELMG